MVNTIKEIISFKRNTDDLKQNTLLQSFITSYFTILYIWIFFKPQAFNN